MKSEEQRITDKSKMTKLINNRQTSSSLNWIKSMGEVSKTLSLCNILIAQKKG